MKHINESIIGRKGVQSSKLWLLYPAGKDFHAALKVLPKDCEIYFDRTNKHKSYDETIILFCINQQQLKNFFDCIKTANRLRTDPNSALFEINARYLKNFEDVENWLDQIPSENFDALIHTANELKEINIPEYIKRL